MLFNSIQFLLFLLAVVSLYNFFPMRLRGLLLLTAGYLFYAFNGIIYLLYLLLVTAISYCGAVVIARAPNNKKKKALVISIIATLSFLLFFKYTDFGITVINDMRLLRGGEPLNLMHLLIPVGISFFTFVAVGYLIDVFRGKITVERNIINFALFISYFPAILSGPIERSYHLLPQLKRFEQTSYQNAREGFILFLWGLFYKVVLADRLALCANHVFSDVYSCHGLSLLMGSLAFTFQIYFDFAGYSYIAMGVSKFFNIHLINNFDKPYLAISLTDFWRRWHISLTSWFRDYLYIPLGGNRVSQTRWICNILIVFLISGLWHGAYYTFLIWGALHAVVQIIEKYIIKDKKTRIGIDRGHISIITACRILLTFCIVSAAWVFFRASSVDDAVYLLKGVCTFSHYSMSQLFTFKGTYILFGMSILDTILSVLLVCSVICMEVLVGLSNDGFAIPKRILSLSPFFRWWTYVILTLFILWFGKLGVSEFVYFNF